MDAYAASFLGLMVLTIVTLTLTAMTGVRKGGAGLEPGETPQGGYGNPLYRLHRTHQNSVEVLAVFAVPLLSAIAVGVSPALLAWATWIYVGLRLAYCWLYLTGTGLGTGGIRTMVFIASSTVTPVVALSAVWKVLT